MTEKVVIALASKIRAGNETVARLLTRRLDAHELHCSAPLYATLRLFGVSGARKNTQVLSTFLRTAFGHGVLEAPLIRAIERSAAQFFVIGSVRRKSDFFELQKRFKFFLLYIDAPVAVRYGRFVNHPKGDADCDLSFEDFLAFDAAETEQEIGVLWEGADFVIENDGTLDGLSKRVDLALAILGVNEGKAVPPA